MNLKGGTQEGLMGRQKDREKEREWRGEDGNREERMEGVVSHTKQKCGCNAGCWVCLRMETRGHLAGNFVLWFVMSAGENTSGLDNLP